MPVQLLSKVIVDLREPVFTFPFPVVRTKLVGD